MYRKAYSVIPSAPLIFAFAATVFLFCLPAMSSAGEKWDIFDGKNALYVFGWVQHADTYERTNEGYIELIGYSREFELGKFTFDTGFNTYVDSYHIRSYSIFSNVSYAPLHYKFITPMAVIGVTNKGKDHDSDARQTYPLIIPKIRFGGRDNIPVFADISALPEVGGITNGWVALEVGFRW